MAVYSSRMHSNALAYSASDGDFSLSALELLQDSRRYLLDQRVDIYRRYGSAVRCPSANLFAKCRA